MIEKMAEDAYFVIDDLSFVSSLNTYSPLISNQTICFEEDELGESIISDDEPYR
jgi:hypothetical protein